MQAEDRVMLIGPNIFQGKSQNGLQMGHTGTYMGPYEPGGKHAVVMWDKLGPMGILESSIALLKE